MSARLDELESEEELLSAYWAAQAQFGPFDVGPMEFLKLCKESQAR